MIEAYAIGLLASLTAAVIYHKIFNSDSKDSNSGDSFDTD